MVHDIAIVGMGCRFPGAPDLAAFWRMIERGEPQVRKIPSARWGHASLYSLGDFRARNKAYTDRGAFLAEIDRFAALHYAIPPRRAQVMDPQHRLLLDAVRAALQDAGLERRPFDRAGAGVFVGASTSEFSNLVAAPGRLEAAVRGFYGDPITDIASQEAMANSVKGVPPIRAFSLVGVLVNMAAATVSQTFDLGGPSFTVDAACSASLVALNEAILHLRAGSCSSAVVGGVFLSMIPDTLISFCKVGALSLSGNCRPFDQRADGFVFGEGVGAVVLRPVEKALEAGDRVYAVIRGIGCVNDGKGEGPMTPEMSGQLSTLRRAYVDAGVDPLSVGYIEAHGTATPIGDGVEAAAMVALRDVPGAVESPCYISSVKSLIGHSLSAAGVASVIKTALCLYHGVIPPQPDVHPNPEHKLEQAGLRLTSERVDWSAAAPVQRRAGVSSFGFGGTNVHAVLEQAAEIKTVPIPDRPELFLFSAGSPKLLDGYLGQILAKVDENPGLSLADLAYTLASRQLLTARAIIVACGRDELRHRIGSARGALAADRTDGRITKGVFLCSEPARVTGRKVAFLFAGQGSQQPGMLADLIERFPQIRTVLDEFDALTKATTGVSVHEAVHGPGADTPEGRQRLTATEVCQPALGAHWLALARFLEALGVQPDQALGHSVGEFAAAASVGVLEPSRAVAFMAERGRVLAHAEMPDPGTMLALRCTRSAAETLVNGVSGAWVANHNQPDQVVISGTHEGIAEVERRAKEGRVAGKRLAVSHAFHSPLLDGSQPEMTELARNYTPSGSAERLISCISGASGHSADELIGVWGRHAVSPVEFDKALRSCDSAGVGVYVQVGGGSALLSFARATLTDRPGNHWFVALGDNGPDDCRTFLYGIGQLAAIGVPVDPATLFADGLHYRILDLPLTPLVTKRYWPIRKAAAKPRHVAKTMSAAASSAAESGDADPSSAAESEDAASSSAVESGDAASSPAAEPEDAASSSAAESGDAASPSVAESEDAASSSAAESEDAASSYSQQEAQSVGVKLSASIARERRASSSMEQLIALFREQTAILAACSGGNLLDEAASGASRSALQALSETTHQAHAAPVSVSTVSAEAAPARIMEEVARVCLFPADVLRTDQTLVAELGFDSIMLTELGSGLIRAFPQLVFGPNDFTMDTTLGELIDYVVKQVRVPGAGDMVVQAAVPVVQAPSPVLSAPVAAVALPVGGNGSAEATAAPAPVPAEAYRVEEFPEVKMLADRMAWADQLGLANPYFMVHGGVSRDTSVVDGRKVITFSSYNYIGMSGHPAVVAAVQEAVATYGSSCSASRMLSGERPIHQELEAELAGLLGTEDALALVSGHATLVTVIGHLAGPGNLLVHDSLAHNSITQGCKLSGATSRSFPHNDHVILDSILANIRHQYRRVFILIEGVYSMDGDIPDLPAFIEVKKKHQALLMIDEAHSIGVLGAKGGGIGEYFDVDRRDVELWVGTMSKSLAGCGGYVGGSRELIRYLRYSTPGFIYSVGITPPNAAASLAAIRQMRAEPEVLTRLHDRSRLFLALAKEAGVKVGDSHDSPVIPCIVGDSVKTVKLAAALFKRGINVMPILYPAVPERMARLRFFVSSCHSEDQIRTTVRALAEELAVLEERADISHAEAELVEAIQTTKAGA